MPVKNEEKNLPQCLESVKDDPAINCVEEYFQCLKKTGHCPNNPDKAKSLAFLASRPITDERTGIAAQKKYWNLDSPAFDEVKSFLKMICE